MPSGKKEALTVINVVRFMLVVFLLVPNAAAAYLFVLSSKQNVKAEIVKGGPATFISERPFVAEGVLRSPSGQSLTSKHFQQPCLAYRIQFDLLHTVVDSDGEEEDRRSELFEERRQVPDLTVEFSSGKALLDVQVLESFYRAQREELDVLPDYVDASQVPKLNTERRWFEVHEAVFSDGQNVTVVGHVNPQGVLEPHIGAEELIVFPGNTAECAAALQDAGSTYKIMGFVMIGMSLLGCLILGIILQFMKH